MPDLLRSMWDSLGNPARLHAAVTHFPIVISVVGAILLVMLACTRGRSPGLRWACVALYLAGAITGFIGYRTGETAEHRLDMPLATVEANEHLEAHEEMGDKVWLAMLGTTALAACTLIRLRLVRFASVALALAAGLFTLGWVAVTAHHGGALVYAHGVGVVSPSSPGALPVARVPTPALGGSAKQPASMPSSQAAE